MKWGRVKNSENIQYELPEDPIENKRVLEGSTGLGRFSVYIGYANLSKAELKGFYPEGITDFLPYYSSQLNAIEFNATFYKNFSKEQFIKWRDKIPGDFKFFPKISKVISHDKHLQPDTFPLVKTYAESLQCLNSKLGIAFLQMPETFKPSNGYHLKQFIANWPPEIPLAIELRHPDWYTDSDVSDRLFSLFEKYNITHIITDTPGKRNLLHMRLTSKTAFIRFLASESPQDFQRLDHWVDRIAHWKEMGLTQACFFIHQDVQKTKPFLAHYLIPKINKVFSTSLVIPNHDYHQPDLFDL